MVNEPLKEMLELVQHTNWRPTEAFWASVALSGSSSGRDAVLPQGVGQPQSSTSEEAPPRNCPKCGSPMAGQAVLKGDRGAAILYYLCRKCPENNGKDYGFTTAMVNTVRPLTPQERHLAGLESAEKLIEKSKKIMALHVKVFPPEGTPQIHKELDLFPTPNLEALAEKRKPLPSTEEILEKSTSLHKIVHKMEDERRAELQEEFDKKAKPILKYIRDEKLRQERNEAFSRPDRTRYGKNGRIEGIPDKPVKR